MKCKICKSDVDLIDDKKMNNIYYHCPRCQVIYLAESEILKSEYERKEYLRHNNDPKNYGYVNMFREMIDRHIIEIIGELKGKKILDYGCGPDPTLSKILKRYNAKVFYYDPYFYDDQRLLKEKYDIVISTEVFEHLKDPFKELQTIYSILKVNGYLIIKTQFHKNDISYFMKWWYRRDPTHIIFYTPKTFKIIANKTFYDIIYTDNEELIIFKKER